MYNNTFPSHLKIKLKIINKNINNQKYYNCCIFGDPNIISGFCLFQYLHKIKCVEIEYICIDKLQQGRGLSKILFDHIFDNYCKKSKYNLTLECETNLIKYYEKLGCRLIPLNYKSSCMSKLNIMIKPCISTIKFSQFYRIVHLLHIVNTVYIHICLFLCRLIYIIGLFYLVYCQIYNKEPYK